MKRASLFVILALSFLLFTGCCKKPIEEAKPDSITIEILPINDGSISPDNQYDGCVSFNGKRHTWGELQNFLEMQVKKAPPEHLIGDENAPRVLCSIPVTISATPETPWKLAQFVYAYCVDMGFFNLSLHVVGDGDESLIHILLPTDLGIETRSEPDPYKFFIAVFGQMKSGKELWKVNSKLVHSLEELRLEIEQIQASLDRKYSLFFVLDCDPDIPFSSVCDKVRLINSFLTGRMILTPPRVPGKQWPKPLPKNIPVLP